MNRNLAVLTVFFFSFAFLSLIVAVVEVVFLVFTAEITPSSDPKEMAGLIAQKLVFAMLILITSPITAAIGLIIMFLNKYRARWYFWTSLMLTLPYVALYPIGTAIFAIAWFYLLLKKQEFKSNHSVSDTTY